MYLILILIKKKKYKRLNFILLIKIAGKIFSFFTLLERARKGTKTESKMHLSENEGIEANTFVVTGGLGFVGSALCLELVRRGARQVRAFDLRLTSPWSDDLKNHGVRLIQGYLFFFSLSLLLYQFPIYFLNLFLLYGIRMC